MATFQDCQHLDIDAREFLFLRPLVREKNFVILYSKHNEILFLLSCAGNFIIPVGEIYCYVGEMREKFIDMREMLEKRFYAGENFQMREAPA